MKHRWGVYTCAGQANKIKSSTELKPVRITDLKLFITINGLIGDVSVGFKFCNNFTNSGPAVFLFPLTHNASVKQCHGVVSSATGHSRTVRLECHPREDQECTKAGYIIEQTASEMVELQLGVISPADEIEVTLQYAMLLNIDETSSVKFVFPSFLPRSLQTNYTELCSPELYNSLNFQCRAVISGNYRIHKLLSDQRLTVQYKDEQRKYLQFDALGLYSPVKDFSFSIIYANINKPHIHLHSPVEESQSGHWLLNSYCAHLTMHHNTRKPATVNRRNEYILCIDRSASMYGDKIEYTKEAISYFVRFLQPGCYFNIISYGSAIQPLFKTSQKLSAYTSMKALKLRKTIKADMFATNIHSLLEFIFAQPNRTHNPKQVYLITDGAVHNPDECVDLVSRNSESARVFTFGLDKTASRHLVSSLARAGNGKAYHLKNAGTLCHKVVDAMRLSAQSSLTDLKVSVQLPPGLEFTTQPDVLPSVLFAEETLSGCILISGQPDNPRQTRCRVVVSGRQDSEKFCHLRDFNLRDALVTHGSPLHQLAIKTHLYNLEKDATLCRNADEILEIHDEMVELSHVTNTVSPQTRHISVDTNTRLCVNKLPIILCRPEQNLSKYSSSGIDIFRSSQVMLKSLISLYTKHGQKSRREESLTSNSSIIKLITTPKTLRKSQTKQQTSRPRTPTANGVKSPADRLLNDIGGAMLTGEEFMGAVGGVRVASDESSDSLRSSLINTELDDMSVSKYESDSSPTEVFNIIEEYPDKGRGSGVEDSEESSPIRAVSRPTDLLNLLRMRMANSKPSHSCTDSVSPGKLTSTSDYYSLEVSPVSDISTNTVLRQRHLPNRMYSKQYPQSDHSSSGVGSKSSVMDLKPPSLSESSVRHSSLATTYLDSEPQYRSLWQQFRNEGSQDGMKKTEAYIKKRRQLSRTDGSPEGRLALYDPSTMGVLAPIPDFSPNRLQAIHDNMLKDHDPLNENQLSSALRHHDYENIEKMGTQPDTNLLTKQKTHRKLNMNHGSKGCGGIPVYENTLPFSNQLRERPPLGLLTVSVDNSLSHSDSEAVRAVFSQTSHSPQRRSHDIHVLARNDAETLHPENQHKPVNLVLPVDSNGYSQLLNNPTQSPSAAMKDSEISSSESNKPMNSLDTIITDTRPRQTGRRGCIPKAKITRELITEDLIKGLPMMDEDVVSDKSLCKEKTNESPSKKSSSFGDYLSRIRKSFRKKSSPDHKT